MKRSKIMLTAIGVLAVVGGALAFKANHFGGKGYCYTLTTVSNVPCTKGATPSTVLAIGTTFVKYTLTTNTTNCSITPPTICTKTGKTITTLQ